MRTSRVVVLAIALFLAGLSIGGYAGMLFWASLVNSLRTESAVSRVSLQLAVLQFLRNGKGESAANLLESELDTELWVIGTGRPGDLPDWSGPILRRAAEYRGKYPRFNHPEVQHSIDRALNMGHP